MTTIRLKDIVQNPTALEAASARLACGEATLDGSGVDALEPPQLARLFAAIPPTWGFAELGNVVDPVTLSDTLAEQLTVWLDERPADGAGTTGVPATETTPPAAPGQLTPEVQAPAATAGADGTGIPDPASSLLPPARPASPYGGAKLRDQLEDAVIADLLGPAGGPEEIIDEPTVRGRYLVGMLAPKGQSALPEAYDDNDLGGTDSEDGTTEAPPPKATTTMLPSSIGLTFAVDQNATGLVVRARWGRYDRALVESDAYKNKDGNLRRVWQRQQIDVASQPLPLVHGRIENWSPAPDYPDVTVQGIMRKRDGQWIVTLFLVNGQQEPVAAKDSAWIFQPELIVTSADGAPSFRKRTPPQDNPDLEEQMMVMLYRNQVEFAVGHGVAVDAEVSPESVDCATRVWTTVVPAYEVPQTTAPTAEDFPALADLTVEMQQLAEVADGQFAQHLQPLVDAYEAWLATQQRRVDHPTPDLLPCINAAEEALHNCRHTLGRIREGIGRLDADSRAAAAFRFANRAMYLQRLRSLYAAAVRRGENVTLADVDTPGKATWRTFQLGFLLLNLPGLTDLRHPDRSLPSGNADANPGSNVADLLWFPTGGGKTEAYLGLAAYTMGLRRLQGEVGGRSGHAGVAVLMRYTLRLLTLQQFQRAAALICACEVIRREDPNRWGSEPFRIGLWVGQGSTPNWVADAEEAVKQLKKGAPPSGGTPHQLTNCPWCGTAIDPGRDLVPESPYGGRGRVFTYCGSLLDHCPFNQRQSPDEGLLVMVVDEEIYRRLPTLLIATVDKFAQMPWNGRTAMLFGQVTGYCERHGYRSPEVEDTDSHPASKHKGLPAARTRPTLPLRPPDLIIQDELHLISGPLGTLVGLYETAVDHLATWEVDGYRVRPKVVASTATIRRAEAQVHGIFLRRVNIFPPQGLDAEDNFWSRQRPPSDTYPGRRYLGICAPGIRHKTALIQTYISFLAAAQQLADTVKTSEVDPWMTLVGYFNSLRELAAMRRAVDDTVSTRLKKMNQRGLTRRFLDPWSMRELTSRLGAADIPEILDRLETIFDPAAKAAAGAHGAGKPSRQHRPIDVLLATNMISVGVDVPRLGLMVVGGQPKATAEYIQATSRVGRRYPGLVTTVYNWARPRDLSHYERFKHYHATFYQHVEALSVTPFSPRAIDRGITGVLAALVRLGEMQFNPNEGAGKVTAEHPIVQDALREIAARAAYVTGASSTEVEQALKTRIETWMTTRKGAVSAALGYKAERDGHTVGLLKHPDGDDWSLFACLNSLRDVEPTVSLVLDDGGLDGDNGPRWTFDAPVDEAETITAESED
ncbi:MAG: DISARM system helicase DrmA [Chloroflexota bacterium]|nr:DISARM system helicase DrmA [Chloroflexota bacterium]